MFKISGVKNQESLTYKWHLDKQKDAVSKQLHKQILLAQKQLEEVAHNKDLDTQTRMDQMKKVREQLVELNNQLTQHELEEKEKKEQEQVEQLQRTQAEPEGLSVTGFSKENMQVMLTADTNIKYSKVARRVAAKMSERANLLKSQFDRDVHHRHMNVVAKQEEIATYEQKAAIATYREISALKRANQVLQKDSNKENSMSTHTLQQQEEDLQAENVQETEMKSDKKHMNVRI